MSQERYQSVDSARPLAHQSFQYNEKPKNGKKKFLIIGGIVLVVLIAVGVTVGVIVSKNSSKSSSGGKSSSSKGGTTQTDANDPSSFTLDPQLKKSFYGMAYTPEGSQIENCHNTLEGVIKDMQVLSQLTTRVRLYGADCNQSALVLEAIKQTKVDMKVYLGNYVIPTDAAPYERQRDLIKAALEQYGTDHVAGITVGNEYMLNYVLASGAATPNDATAKVGADILKTYIADTRSMLAGMGMSNIQVGNSDAGSYFNTEVLESVDYGLSNVHAWFANTTEAESAAWTTTFFNEQNVAPAALLANKPTMYIAETGWPTGSKDAGNLSNGFATASESGLQTFLDTFVCQANQNKVPYFYFELFDEQWKDDRFGGVEGYWGLFNKDRSLKNIKLPDCASP